MSLWYRILIFAVILSCMIQFEIGSYSNKTAVYETVEVVKLSQIMNDQCFLPSCPYIYIFRLGIPYNLD